MPALAPKADVSQPRHLRAALCQKQTLIAAAIGEVTRADGNPSAIRPAPQFSSGVLLGPYSTTLEGYMMPHLTE
jgi:hypothetical protein